MAKTVSQQDNPFPPPNVRSKSAAGRYRNRGGTSTTSTNVVLTTFGSIPQNAQADVEQSGGDVRLVGAKGGEDGLVDESTGATPAPAYDSFEMGYTGTGTQASGESGIAGIRIDVEKATLER